MGEGLYHKQTVEESKKQISVEFAGREIERQKELEHAGTLVIHNSE